MCLPAKTTTGSEGRGFSAGDKSSGAADTARPPLWKLFVELVRCLVIAVVVAGLAVQVGTLGWTGATLLGFSLWIGFPVVL